MALIRQANAATIARDALVLDLGDLVRQGETLRARARAEAEQIIAEAHAERARILAAAADEGRAQGLAKGLEEGRTKGREEGLAQAKADLKGRLEALDQRWASLLDEFNQSRERLLLEAREDVLRLAVMLGEKIVKRHLASDPTSVLDQLSATLALLAKPTRVSISIHPDDLPLVQDALPRLASSLASASHAEVTPDPALHRGDCILRTPSGGQIDATIQTQLDRIAESLLPARDPQEPAP